MTENELERYMRQHYRSVYRTALCRCKNPQDADDVAQDVFLKLYTCGERFEDDDHVKAWLIRCAINHSIDVLRSRKRRNTVSLDAAADKAHYDDKDEDGGRVFELFLKLSEKNRTAMYMHYCEGYSVREIAEITRINENAVLSRLMRGRKQLEKLLNKERSAENGI
ncbi:MAG: RNA polymerase sigma factor [Ruminiclostridium sp.]|nr:RNA polymerase sigma factor [Ruminiclostridium sp.]